MEFLIEISKKKLAQLKANCLIWKGKAPDELLVEVSDLLSNLESGSRIFDVDSDRIQRSCGNGLGLVKDEVYTGNLITQKVQQKSQQKS